MDFIISLAHFCEVHGPTSILCTQLNPVNCHTCFPCPTPPPEQHDLSRDAPPFSTTFWDPPTSPGLSTATAPLLYSPFNSPPTSPRPTNGPYSNNDYFGGAYSSHGSGDSISRLSVGSDSDEDSCNNCTFLLPKDMSESLPDGAPGSPTKDGKGRHGSPILRTTQAIVAHLPPEDYQTYACSEDDGTTDAETPIQDDRNEEDLIDTLLDSLPSARTNSTGSQRSCSSHSGSHSASHTHHLQYVSTRQPTSPSSYSLLRRSCIRTLSCESLPRGSQSGPLYFGDPVAGYTVAYIFRLPDPRARGRRRIYALLALGGRDSWRVSTAYVTITKAFESIAGQIVAAADQVLERESAASAASHSPRPSTTSFHAPLSSSLPSPLTTTIAPASPEQQERARSATTSPVRDVSSFLSARKVDPDGYPRVSREVMRAKGLAEIVGNEKFFLELHARFCVLLAGLVREFTSRG